MRGLLAALLAVAVLALTWVAMPSASQATDETNDSTSTSLAADPARSTGTPPRAGSPTIVEGEGISLEAPIAIRPERMAGDSAGSNGEGAGHRPESFNEGEAVHPVVFTVRHPIGIQENTTAHLLVRAADEETPERLPYPPESELNVALARGEYLAAVEIPEVGVGPTVTFAVTDGGADVLLEAPYRFDLGMTALLRSTELPLEGVEFIVERTDDPARLAGAGRISSRTAPDGKARLEGLVQGEWHLTSIADEYWSYDWDLSLPFADTLPSIRTQGRMQMTPILFDPIESISLRLDPPSAALDPERYTAEYHWRPETTPFGPDGRVVLTLTDHYFPLFVEVNDREGTLLEYFIGQHPEEGEDYLIPLEGPRVLEVDVRIGESVRELGEDWQLMLVVFHRMANGDDAIVNLEIPGEGVYEVPYAQSDVVDVCLKAWREPELHSYVSKEVRLAPEGRTACILRADGPPPQIKVVDVSGKGLAKHHVQVLRLPRNTGWLDGGRTDEEGLLSIDLSRTRTNYLMLSDEGGGNILGLDIPLDLSEARLDEGPVLIPTAPTTTTYLQMEPGSGDPGDVIIRLEGARTGFVYAGSALDESGRSRESELIEGSQGEVVLDLASQWSPTPRFPLKPGRNAFRVHATGTLTLSSTDHLGAVRCTEYDQTLADWKAADNLATTSSGTLVECTVPIGAYGITFADGSTSTIHVRKGESIHGGL